MALNGGTEIQLLPAGSFRAHDGRPTDAPGWLLTAELAQVLIAAADARANPYVIDYEHQTLLARENGKPAPAAGWYKKLEWRDGIGLFAVDVEWTAQAQEFIATGQYKYISPVIGYDKTTGAVTALFMAAATNNPAIDGMDTVLLAAAALHFTFPTAALTQELHMNIEDLLKSLRWILNLPPGATMAECSAQLQRLTDLIKADAPAEAAAAASFDLAGLITTQRTAIASLSAATPDPARYVPIAAMQAVQQQVAQLTAQGNAGQVDIAVKAALAAGKLVPAQEAWARSLGNQNLASLNAYLDSASAIVHPNTTQTSNEVPPGAKVPGALTANQVALCAAMGLDEKEFLKTLQAHAA